MFLRHLLVGACCFRYLCDNEMQYMSVWITGPSFWNLILQNPRHSFTVQYYETGLCLIGTPAWQNMCTCSIWARCYNLQKLGCRKYHKRGPAMDFSNWPNNKVELLLKVSVSNTCNSLSTLHSPLVAKAEDDCFLQEKVHVIGTWQIRE